MENRTPEVVASGVLSGARMVSSEDFTPVRAGFDSLALHHNHYIKSDKGSAMNKDEDTPLTGISDWARLGPDRAGFP